MSNTERQRRFRERNPGYYQRLHAKRRARIKAAVEQCARERAARKQAIEQIIAPPMQLCLPAPDQVSVQTIDFAALVREHQAAVAAAEERATGRWSTNKPV